MRTKTHRLLDDGWNVQQLDGTFISIRDCTCPPYYVNGGYHYTFECPIDRHKARAFRERWEFDDNGTIITREDLPGNE